jgi:RNA polymerase sigma factor (sigma-70 family)
MASGENPTMTTTRAGIVLRHIRGLAAADASTQAADWRLLERFAVRRDEAAFAALVRRHGPMVLGVCRRVLGNSHDAEDAFQATFLALAGRARSFGKAESLGGWLYRVAYNTALKARASAAARLRRERRSGERPCPDPLSEVTGRELLAVLDEELQRLPERDRLPLVLCHLEGLTCDEAATRLGYSTSTLKRRLDEGRARLRKRLEPRAGAVGGAADGRRGRGRGLPVAGRYHRRGGPACRGGQAAGTCRRRRDPAGTRRRLPKGRRPPRRGLSRRGGRVARATLPGRQRRGLPLKVRPEKAVAGRVLDPDGKPAAGAKVYYLRSTAPGQFARLRPEDRPTPKPETVTDSDGRFSFPQPAEAGSLFVTAPGCGPAWVLKPGKLEDNPLRLARDDVPVTGRVVDLQGQPVAGAVVRVHALKAPREGTLDKWLEAVKSGADGMRDERDHLTMFAHIDLPHCFPPVETDREGRFEIKGIGRERVAALIIEAPAVETREVNVVTRPGVKAVSTRRDGDPLGDERLFYYPPKFDHAAAPGRVVSGVVRDKATGKPVAGAVVRLSEDALLANPLYFLKTTTDREGNYRLTGLLLKSPEFRRSEIVVLPPEGEPYLALRRALPENDTKPAVFDFDLPRGVWLEGQVKDKVTGRGVLARLGYFVFGDGPDKDLARTLYIPPMPGLAHWTDRDGKYRIVAAPCRGMIGARAVGDAADHYRIGLGAEAIEGGKGEGGTLRFHAYPHTASADDFETLAEVKPSDGAKSFRCDLLLDPGRTVKVQVRGPDGKPLAGARAHGQFARAWWGDEVLPAEFSVYGLEPGKGRTLLLKHGDRDLVARYEIKGDERGPVVATLQPAARVSGRLVDDGGRPLAGAAITVTFRRGKNGPLEMHSRDFRTDEDGRFRIDGLLPGMSYSADVQPADAKYRWWIFEGLALKAGESKDLGTVKPTKRDE